MNFNRVTIGSSEKIGLIGNLATMLSSGIPILDAVDSLLEDARGGQKKILETMRDDLVQGEHIHVTLAKFPRVFDRVTVSVIRASEEAGTLDITLKDLRGTIQKEMELVVTKLHTKNLELEKIKKDIEEIKDNKKIKEEELKKLDKLKENQTSLLTEVEKIEEKIDAKWENLKPFPDEQAKNRLVIINPYLGGYKCFYNKELELKEYPISSLVHRWVWKHKTGNWPKPGYHIHHIDGDKYNNNPDNLEEIHGEEHYERHRNK